MTRCRCVAASNFHGAVTMPCWRSSIWCAPHAQSRRSTGNIDAQQKFVALQSRRSTSELSRAAKRLRLNELLGRTGRASDGRDQRISLKARLAANGFVNIAPHTEAVRLPA